MDKLDAFRSGKLSASMKCFFKRVSTYSLFLALFHVASETENLILDIISSTFFEYFFIKNVFAALPFHKKNLFFIAKPSP